MATATSTVTTFEQLNALPDIAALSVVLTQRAERVEHQFARATDLAGRKTETLDQLDTSTSERNTKRARAHLTALLAEAAILPQEVTFAANAFALALHNWSAACFAETADLRQAADAECYEALEQIHRDNPDETDAILHMRGQGPRAVFQARELEITQIERQVLDAIGTVFATETMPTYFINSTVDERGKVHGHEQWLEHQLAEVKRELDG